MLMEITITRNLTTFPLFHSSIHRLFNNFLLFKPLFRASVVSEEKFCLGEKISFSCSIHAGCVYEYFFMRLKFLILLFSSHSLPCLNICGHFCLYANSSNYLWFNKEAVRNLCKERKDFNISFYNKSILDWDVLRLGWVSLKWYFDSEIISQLRMKKKSFTFDIFLQPFSHRSFYMWDKRDLWWWNYEVYFWLSRKEIFYFLILNYFFNLF